MVASVIRKKFTIFEIVAISARTQSGQSRSPQNLNLY